MKSNRDESSGMFASRIVLKRAKPLLKEADGVRKGKDVECVHKMRVATRRLSAALALFEDRFPRKHVRFWQKRLRRLRKALGQARDLDVQIAFVKEFLQQSNEFLGGSPEVEYRPGIRQLLLRLKQRRAGRRGKIIKALNRFEKRGVLEDLKRTVKGVRSACQSPGAGDDGIRIPASEAILRRLGDLLALEPCVGQPENIEQHHAMRIAAKRLRYTLEVFRPLYGRPTARFVTAAREAQQMLGEIHDCDVWVEFLPQFLEDEEERTAAQLRSAKKQSDVRSGIIFLQQDRRRQRERRFDDFAAFWDALRKDRLWEQLAALVRAGAVEDRPAAAPHSPSEAA